MAASLLENLFGHPGSFSWPEPEILEDVFWQVIQPQNYRSACDLPQTDDQPKEDQPGTSREGTAKGHCSRGEGPRDFQREFNQFCRNFRGRSCRRPDGGCKPGTASRRPEACAKPAAGHCCPKRDEKKFVGDKFEVHLNLRYFKPEEIVVKLTGDNKTVIVDTKHEEREDEHGSVYRHFVRKYNIPEGHDVSKLESKLSPDGILTITAPKILAVDSSGIINIPVIRTEEPLPEKMEEVNGENAKVEESVEPMEAVEEKKEETDEKKSEGSDDASFLML